MSSPQEALESYVAELEREYRPWYERSVTRVTLAYSLLQVTSILSGFLATIMAALVAANSGFFEDTPSKVFLVVVPALGATAGTLIAQFKVLELVDLRESGRLIITTILADLKWQVPALKSPEDASALHKAIVAKVDALEAAQARGFVLRMPSAAQSRGAEPVPPVDEDLAPAPVDQRTDVAAPRPMLVQPPPQPEAKTDAAPPEPATGSEGERKLMTAGAGSRG
jgi:hypothetical protein